MFIGWDNIKKEVNRDFDVVTSVNYEGTGGPIYQLTTHPGKQDPSHPPYELVRNLLPDELT